MSAPPPDAAPPRWIAYEKDAAIAIGQLIGETEKSVSLANGDKIPRRRVWLYDAPPPSDDLQQQLAAAMPPLDSLWRAADGRMLTLDALAAAAGAESPLAQLAVLQQVIDNPIYFRRRENQIEAVPEETVRRALAAQQTRRQQREDEDALLQQLQAGALPPLLADAADSLLYAPDKSAAPYRVLKRHTGGDGAAFAAFFLSHGLLESDLHYLDEAFARLWPPPPAVTLNPPPPLPPAAAPAISIDDEGTREIDDAFSIAPADNGGWRVGIHIAAPALTLSGDDNAAGEGSTDPRLVSVYFPHAKHFMLSPDALDACSLAVGKPRPALSLYLHINGEEWRVTETLVEMVTLSDALTPDAADGDSLTPQQQQTLSRLAAAADTLAPFAGLGDGNYNHKIDPTRMTVTVQPRAGAARMVEIFMRAANLLWAADLAAAKRGGLYRATGAFHLHPPKPPYMWLTSPLRRQVDFANQRLLLSALGALPPRRTDWRSLRRRFDRQHSQARHHQRIMDSYWSLRILQGEDTGAPRNGIYLGRRRVRVDGYPLVGILPAALSGVQEGAAVQVRVTDINLLTQRLWLTPADAAP